MRAKIERREFITLLGGAAAAWPLPARAQQMARLPTVGFLGAGSPATADVWVSAFTSRLRELGWIEDRNIKSEVRWAEGRSDRSAEIATELVRLKVDVIVTYSTEQTHIAKKATSIIPIVFALASDPVGSDLVTSLARPGGNLTGLSSQNVDLTGKRFELLARSFRVCVDWRSCSTATTRPPCQRSASFGPLPAPSVSRYLHRRFWVPKILPPPSRRSRSRLMRCS